MPTVSFYIPANLWRQLRVRTRGLTPGLDPRWHNPADSVEVDEQTATFARELALEAVRNHLREGSND